MRSRLKLGYGCLAAVYGLAVVGAVALLLFADPGSARSQIPGRTYEHKVSWNLWSPVASQHEGRVLSISLVSGYCVGERRPVAGKASVVELPADATHPHPRTIITAHVIAPVRHETKREKEEFLCEDLGLFIPKRVKLKRPIRGTVFLDGSYDPPRPVRPEGR
ncbi:MAG TPA: hypothetical protein VN671_05160 [Solirubrobacterales bacterium]|nr:hypothetical protein [Solirubrobacterales bacterium]